MPSANGPRVARRARSGMTPVTPGRGTVPTPRAMRARAEIRNGSDTGDLIAELDAMMAIINPERVKAEARRGEESQ